MSSMIGVSVEAVVAISFGGEEAEILLGKIGVYLKGHTLVERPVHQPAWNDLSFYLSLNLIAHAQRLNAVTAMPAFLYMYSQIQILREM